jgi:hypothetical protein
VSLWSDVRADVLRRLEQHAPALPFEMRVMIAEDAAREVDDGTWLEAAKPEPDDSEATS